MPGQADAHTPDVPAEIVIQVDEVIADLVPGYLASRRAELEQVSEWLDAEDFEALEVLGHRLKGSGAGYGFEAISELGGDLEAAGVGRDLPRARRVAGELANYLQALRLEMP